MIALLWLSGCLTTPVQRVETLGEGNREVGVELGAGIPDNGIGEPVVGEWLPVVNVSKRLGITDRFDVGCRFGTNGYELQSKVMLTRRDARMVLSVAPSFMTSYSVTDLRLPLMLGLNLGPHQVVVVPAVMLRHNAPLFRSSWTTLDPRLSVGFAAQITPRVRLHPEIVSSNRIYPIGGRWQGWETRRLRVTAVLGVVVTVPRSTPAYGPPSSGD